MTARSLWAIALMGLLACPAAAQQDALSPDLPGGEDLPAPSAPPPALPTRVIPLPADEVVTPASPVLTIDQNRLYLESAWGLRAQAVLEEQGDLVAAENERLTQLLSSEEAALTDRRAGLAAAEFRRMAENFDIRATEVRRERAQAVQALNSWADADRAAFYRAALPYMGDLMAERGAVVVLDHRTVFVSLEAIDITEPLIEIINAELGDGDGAVPLPDETPAP
ncbi:MAG: OmpH family outer membrane protein [Paracoccus sp. (in: a-proteobacteria)]